MFSQYGILANVWPVQLDLLVRTPWCYYTNTHKASGCVSVHTVLHYAHSSIVTDWLLQPQVVHMPQARGLYSNCNLRFNTLSNSRFSHRISSCTSGWPQSSWGNYFASTSLNSAKITEISYHTEHYVFLCFCFCFEKGLSMYLSLAVSEFTM